MNKLLLIPDDAGGGGGDFVDSMVAEMTAASSAGSSAGQANGGAAGATAPATETTPAPPGGGATVPAKPAGQAAAPAAAKPTTVAAPAKAAEAPGGAATTPTLDWKTAPKQFKEAHEALKTKFETTERELKGKLFTTEQQMRALENKRFLTPEQEQRYAKLETRQQELESELYSRDFRESPEFKTKYQAKADKIFATVQNELKGILITDGEGERAASLTDFAVIRNATTQTEAHRKARELFGDDAPVILGLVRELKAVEEAANEEIESKRTGFATERQQQQQKQQTELQNGQQVFGSYDKLLVEKFPDYFAPKEGNTEFNSALEQGMTYVDTHSKGFNAKTPEERAQTAAMLRRWAGAWPANQILLKQNAAKIAELEAAILKLQGSDPGAGGEATGVAANGGTDLGGTDAMSDEIAKLSQQV